MCRSAPAHLAKVADVLVQLLQTEDAAEHSLVQGALVTLLQVDAKGRDQPLIIGGGGFILQIKTNDLWFVKLF